MSNIAITRHVDYCVARFRAMAGPCEILVETDDEHYALTLAQIARQEALRVEKKFSRYRNDNIMHAINTANGKPVEVDDECGSLLDYAQHCYQLSDGLFDITSGILRRAWKFDGSASFPQQQQIDELLDYVGWQKLQWQNPVIQLLPGMEIDLGGIGKEYAVDQTTKLLRDDSHTSCLVNFGGDIRVSRTRTSTNAWAIGIENPYHTSNHISHASNPASNIQLYRGALATSGDARKYLLKNGIRYSHIINPLTGWAVTGAPRSITVAANTCTEAGILSTLAMLHGTEAEEFLKQQGVNYWCVW